MTKNLARRKLIAFGAVAALGAALAGCSSSSNDSSDAASSVALTDAWVKAADGGMTALFGSLANSSGSLITLTAASSPVSPRVELHEMAADGSGSMTMRQKQGGIEVPAAGSHDLAPGGDHVMLFDLPQPVRAGTEVPLTFTFSDGSTAEFTAQVRDFSGAKEEYSESHGG